MLIFVKHKFNQQNILNMKKLVSILAVVLFLGAFTTSCTEDVLGEDNNEVSTNTLLTGDETSSDIDDDREG